MLSIIDAGPRSDVGRAKTIARDPRWPGPAVPTGEMLRAEFLKPLGIAQREAARRMGISAHRLNEFVCSKQRVTVDTARRLSQLLKRLHPSSECAFGLTGTCTARPIGSRRESPTWRNLGHAKPARTAKTSGGGNTMFSDPQCEQYLL